MKKYLSRLLALLLTLVLLIVPASALTVDQALELLEEIYYYEIPEEAYEAETVDELIQILGDPYTAYMNPEQYQAFLDSLEGDTNLVGIGVTIQYTNDGILIVETVPGGSAREAGFQVGDLIVEIDGISCVPAGAASGDLISGEEGTTLDITILRDGQRSTHTLTRRPVVIPNTDIQLLDGGIGYIDCNRFGLNTGEEFADLIKANDSKVNVWILDLRGNGGGYVNAATDMLSALMGPDRYVYCEYGDGSIEYVPGLDRAATKKPLVVLTDGDSASASEIVASNVRDGGRGITVGSRTYGKGVAQAMLNGEVLPDYFDGDGLKVTTYRFYSGYLNTTDKIGVIPTLMVDGGKTDSVARALCGRESGARLRLKLGAGTYYYVNAGTDGETLSALLSALPPQADLAYSDNGWSFKTCTPAEAAAKLGVSYDSRWFKDVADSKYADAINAMGTYLLLLGDGKGSFNPKGQLTRAELCSMMAQVLNVRYQGESLFTDVDQNAWYGPSVNAMAYLELVNGVGGGRFDPSANITQEEFLTIMGRVVRFLNLELDAYGKWIEEKDSNLTASQRSALSAYSEWARTNVAILAWGLDEGFDSTEDMLFAPLAELSPKTAILREEAAAGMYAVLSGLEILP